MAFQISPGVNVSEIDLTTVVPSVLTSAGAFAGYFPWGPAQKIIQIPDEKTLVNRFTGGMGPDSNSAISFFTASSFLAYGNNLQVVRSVGANAKNAMANTASGTTVQVLNSDNFQASYLNVTSANTYGPFIARYPGALGNSLAVSVCDNSTTFNTWVYKNYFSSSPNTSTYVANAGGSYDEMHVVVLDSTGLITGTANTVLETFPFISKAIDATVNGNSNYYRQVIFNQSQWIQSTDPVDYANTSSTWGSAATNTSYRQLVTAPTFNLGLGADAIATDATLPNSYALFNNKEAIDISLVLTGNASIAVQQYVIDNIVNSRADCLAFLSPPQTSVVNQSGSEASNIITWLGTLARSTSFAVVDSGWKYMYDVYNQTYRWIPLNGDIAGLCAYTDTIKDPWYSPAGFNRGNIKNAIKLAWNPSKTYRDTLYAAGVNPVVSFPGNGIVLYGDKTLQSKPSVFDRINVRRLFITLEKAITKAAQYSLFEFNDDFTRAQFVALVAPFLRDIQGRRGITDFRVVCDTTNNTSQVINSNQFVGDIYIKPARSINFIQLNFVAVGTGVDFSTVVGGSSSNSIPLGIV
jgi:phage tail sheath protein FI